jgi:hypothetical protein
MLPVILRLESSNNTEGFKEKPARSDGIMKSNIMWKTHKINVKSPDMKRKQKMNSYAQHLALAAEEIRAFAIGEEGRKWDSQWYQQIAERAVGNRL